MINPFSFSALIRDWSIALLMIFSLNANLTIAADKSYQVNQGDKLRINVWHEEELKAEVMVSPDGTITFPFIGTVVVAGKTLDQLQEDLREQLAEYIPEPEVIVSLITVEGNVVYVIGEVARPGSYVMTKNLKVMQALSMAGGLTPYASRGSIRILRDDSDGKSTSIPFSYGDVEDGDDLASNILLQSDDTIIVP